MTLFENGVTINTQSQNLRRYFENLTQFLGQFNYSLKRHSDSKVLPIWLIVVLKSTEVILKRSFPSRKRGQKREHGRGFTVTNPNKNKDLNMSNKTTITIPSGIKYLSQYYKSINQPLDLPHNSYIMKGMTGVGGSSIALENGTNYIIACHVTSFIEEKTRKYNYVVDTETGELKFNFMKVLGVKAKVSNEDIIKYLTNPYVPVKKIMVTYDSLPRLVDLLNSDEVKELSCSSFNLLVDEVHKLIEYLDGFKVRVCLNLLSNVFNFNSVSFMTATTTPLEYLPDLFKSLDIVEYQWADAITPKISRKYVTTALTDELLAFTLDKLDNTSNELYFFYNEKLGVVNLIKKLMKCKPSVTMKDINIVFAKNKENQDYFKKRLGKDFDVYSGTIPNGYNNKRINFISSTAFEGVDYIANCKDREAYPLSIIVSNPKKKSGRVDIATDMCQILGRFRAYPDTQEFPKNDYYFMYSSYMDELVLSEDDYKEKLKLEETETFEVFKMYEDTHNNVQKRMLILTARSNESDFLMLNQDISDEVEIKEEIEPMLNPYAYNARMSRYATMHQDYKTNGVESDTPNISNKLTSAYDPNDFNIPEISSTYMSMLNRKASLKTLVSELIQCEEAREVALEERSYAKIHKIKERVEEILVQDTMLEDWLDYGISPSRIKALGYERSKVTALKERIRMLSDNANLCYSQLGLRLNTPYTRDHIIECVQKLYDNFNICVKGTETKKAKATDINIWYVSKLGKTKEGDQRVNTMIMLKKQPNIMIIPYTDMYNFGYGNTND